MLTSVVSKCPHTWTRCSSEQQPSNNVRMHPIDTNLHASSNIGIMPPGIRRNKTWLALLSRAEADDHQILHNLVTTSTPGRKRLQSRHPFSARSEQSTNDAHDRTTGKGLGKRDGTSPAAAKRIHPYSIKQTYMTLASAPEPYAFVMCIGHIVTSLWHDRVYQRIYNIMISTIRLFFCPPPFQPSQCWVKIVVIMLLCSMLEISDVVRWPPFPRSTL